ncbi:conserved hypothetical protein, partial [Perkinsus marinus ATCC 50983]
MPRLGMKYHKTTEVERTRILEARANGQCPYAIGKAHGIPRSTITSILKRDTAKYERRGGHRQAKITHEIKAYLEERIEAKADCTLRELKDEIHVFFNVDVTEQAIGNALDGMSYTVKELRPMSVTVNNDVNKNKRFEYAQKIMGLQGNGHRTYWMDE